MPRASHPDVGDQDRHRVDRLEEPGAALGRRVMVGSLQIRWGNPLGVEVTDLEIANASWGSKPEMVQIGQISALVDLGSLLSGTFRYERLRIADARIVLERDAHGNG